MAKNIDWIDTDNRLTVKKYRLDRWSLEEKNLEPTVRFYQKNIFFSDRWLILSVKNEKFLTHGSILSVASMTNSIAPVRLCPAKCNNGKKGQCQKICCTELWKIRKRGIFFNKKLHRIRGLKGVCGIKWREITHMISLYFIPHTTFNPRILCSFLLKNIPLLSSF